MPKTYIKDESFDPLYNPINKAFFFRTRLLPSSILTLSLLLLLTQVVIPLVSFTTLDTVSTPVTKTALGKVSGFSEFEFAELKEQKESRVLGATSVTKNEAEEEFFYLTVLKLGIESALVEINSPTLQPDEALGHYAKSALPGEVGNSFVYGHSVLPFFYNPKNYKTIFSTLGKLEAGDEFYVTYKGNELTYKVEGKRDLKPEEVDPLGLIKPKFLNESTMVLMTCSPPGTKINRLLVDAVLVD